MENSQLEKQLQIANIENFQLKKQLQIANKLNKVYTFPCAFVDCNNCIFRMCKLEEIKHKIHDGE